MKKFNYLAILLMAFVFAGCPENPNFPDELEPPIDEINMDLLSGSWLLIESIYDDVSTTAITQRDFTLTFTDSGTVIKRYLDADQFEMYSYRIIAETFISIELNDIELTHKVLALNNKMLKWHLDYGENLWCRQTFQKIEDVIINDIHAPEGAINGVFSVGENKRIYFSQGNLTYLPCENRFRFHEKQYDRCSMLNNVYTVDDCWTWKYWIDLFFWGTSGWDGGVYDYRPGTRNNKNEYYYINNDITQDMTGEYAEADWGVYNKIENGGNQEGLWRVLSADEIMYLFSKRPNAGNLFAFADVYGVNGMIIFPDKFVCPSNITIKTYKEAGTDPKNNKLSFVEFALLEQLGVVFLPGCGKANYLAGTMVETKPGWYWTSTTGVVTSTYVQCLYFDEEKTGIVETIRNEGHSIRLVQEVK